MPTPAMTRPKQHRFSISKAESRTHLFMYIIQTLSEEFGENLEILMSEMNCYMSSGMLTHSLFHLLVLGQFHAALDLSLEFNPEQSKQKQKKSKIS